MRRLTATDCPVAAKAVDVLKSEEKERNPSQKRDFLAVTRLALTWIGKDEPLQKVESRLLIHDAEPSCSFSLPRFSISSNHGSIPIGFLSAIHSLYLVASYPFQQHVLIGLSSGDLQKDIGQLDLTV